MSTLGLDGYHLLPVVSNQKRAWKSMVARANLWSERCVANSWDCGRAFNAVDVCVQAGLVSSVVSLQRLETKMEKHAWLIEPRSPEMGLTHPSLLPGLESGSYDYRWSTASVPLQYEQ